MFSYIYRCPECGRITFAYRPNDLCKCGTHMTLVWDKDAPGKYKDVRVEGGFAYFWTRCNNGHWHYAPYFDGHVQHDICCEACSLEDATEERIESATLDYCYRMLMRTPVPA